LVTLRVLSCIALHIMYLSCIGWGLIPPFEY
jgi:hypothetical protein